MSGSSAAELFYDPDKFVRGGALPRAMQRTLVGEGAVQGLDGIEHRHRKAMFMSLMSANRVEQLCDMFEAELIAAVSSWAPGGGVVLYNELHEVLTRAVCAWAGVPLSEHEVATRTRQLTSMFNDAGKLPLGHMRARLSRKGAEHWLSGLVEDIRSGALRVPDDAACGIIALHRQLDGQLLKPRIAAVEILNILRPTVAVSVWMALAAHALSQHKHCREELLEDTSGDYLFWFAQEVRRFYPFFPFLMARVREDFIWRGYRFPKGMRVLLDIYGTDHDPRTWDEPNLFWPGRFAAHPEEFRFIPQGGGNPDDTHRCAGESIAVELLKRAITMFTSKIAYDVPPQDMTIDISQMPALPTDRMLISNVRLLG